MMFIREPMSSAGKRGAQIPSALFWGRGNSSRDWCWVLALTTGVPWNYLRPEPQGEGRLERLVVQLCGIGDLYRFLTGVPVFTHVLLSMEKTVKLSNSELPR